MRLVQPRAGSIVAIQDADLELDPARISELVAPILGHQTAVVARIAVSRLAAPRSGGDARRQSVLTWVTNPYGAALTDMETCYKIMRIEVARSLPLEADRFDIEPEITAQLLRRGYRIHELPVRFAPRSRAAGKKIGWRDGLTAVAVLVRLKFARPRNPPRR